MTVVFGDGIAKKAKGGAENAPKAVEKKEKPVSTAKRRGAKKEK